MNPTNLQVKRQLSVMKERVFYMANHIKFYSITSQVGTVFYFVAQSLALMSIFSVSPVFDRSDPTIELINEINAAFFFYSSSVYQSFDSSLAVSHFVSLFLLLIFCAIAYFTKTINYHRRIVISKADSNKIQITEMLVFLLVSLNIPLGSFCSYYLIQLIGTGMEYLLIIPVLNLIFLFSLVYIIEECSIQTNLKSYRALSRLYNKKQSLQAISKMVVRMVVTSFYNLPTNVIIVSVMILLIFDLYELRITIFSKKYLSATTESTYSFKNICVVVIEVLMIICLLTDVPQIVSNFFLATISTSILAFISLTKFKDHNKRQLIFEGIDYVKNEDDAKIYMLESIGMLGQKKNHEEIFTVGMVTLHMESCQITTCFCKRYLQQKKELVKKDDFLKRFVLTHLQGVVSKFQKSFLFISILCNYKLSIMSSYSKIYELLKHQIQQNQENTNSFSQQYILYQIEVIIEQYIHNNSLDTKAKGMDAEKIFREETLKRELTVILNNINDKLFEKYKLLSQEICNLNLIENICDQISDGIRQVEQKWTVFKKGDSYNLKIYEMFLIYFEYIIYSRKQVAEVKNIILRKTQSLHHLKGINRGNLDRYLYSNMACVVEVTASKEKLGIITNASSFCYDVFKVTKDRLINKGIHDIMPQYIVQAHRCWSHDWIDQQSMNGKLLGIVNTHYVDAKGNCFSASIHMKIVSVGVRLKFYIMMIRDNSNDYVLLNDNLQIQGYGYRLQNEHIFNKSALKTHINKYCQLNLKEEMGHANSIKRRIVFINEDNPIVEVLTNPNTTTNLADLEPELPKITETFINECEVLIERNTRHKLNFYTIKFLDIKKLKKNNYQYLSKTIRMSVNFKSMISNLVLKDQSSYRSKKYVEIAQDGDQVESSKDKNILYSQCEEENKFQLRNNMSSIAESSVGEANVVFSKLIEEIKQKTVDFRKSHDRKIGMVTSIIVLLSFTVIAISWIQTSIFRQGMQSYSQIVTADRFLSQNSIILESIYIKQLAVKLYCFDNTTYDLSRCNYLLRSSSIMLNIYYNQSLQNMQDYLKSKTYLSRVNFYSARQRPINLQMGNLTTSISTRQFIQYFYYALNQIVNRIQPDSHGLDSMVNSSYELIFTNWLSMKEANKQALAFYRNAGGKQLNILQTLIFVLSGAYLIFIVLLAVSCKIYYMYKQKKKFQVIKLYGFLNHSTCNYLKQINQGTRNCLKTSYSQILSDIQMRGLSDSKQKSQTKYKKDKRINYIILIFLAVLSSINISIILQATALFQPATFILDTMENLIRAEGDVFESYLEIKTYYLNYNFSLTPPQLSQKLIGLLNSSDITFAKYGKQAISTFSQLDPSFQTIFKEQFTDNICEMLQKSFINEYQIAKCFSGMHFGILQEGIVQAMGFYQRKTYKALLDLTLGNVTDTSSYFKSDVYEDMDDYIFYIYLVCQLIQNSMIQGIIKGTDGTNVSITNLMTIEIALVGLSLILWVGRLDNEKKKMSNLYGAVLQLPQILFKENKVIIRILKENLNLKF